MTKAEKLLQAVVKSAKSFKTGEDKYSPKNLRV